MKNQNEIQVALQIWDLINTLNELLWDRYEKEFLEIHLKEEDDQFLRTLETSDLIETQQDETETSE